MSEGKRGDFTEGRSAEPSPVIRGGGEGEVRGGPGSGFVAKDHFSGAFRSVRSAAKGDRGVSVVPRCARECNRCINPHCRHGRPWDSRFSSRVGPPL